MVKNLDKHGGERLVIQDKKIRSLFFLGTVHEMMCKVFDCENGILKLNVRKDCDMFMLLCAKEIWDSSVKGVEIFHVRTNTYTHTHTHNIIIINNNNNNNNNSYPAVSRVPLSTLCRSSPAAGPGCDGDAGRLLPHWVPGSRAGPRPGPEERAAVRGARPRVSQDPAGGS